MRKTGKTPHLCGVFIFNMVLHYRHLYSSLQSVFVFISFIQLSLFIIKAYLTALYKRFCDDAPVFLTFF